MGLIACFMALSQQARAELLDSILHVAVNCPVAQSEPIDCPLHEVREMELRERLKWLNRLPDDDLSYLAAYHCVCFKFKSELLRARI